MKRYFFTLVLAFWTITIYAQDAYLDSDFGDQGRWMIDFNGRDDICQSIALQDDGKILISGTSFFDKDRIALVRCHPEGQLDQDFGDQGKVLVDANSLGSRGYDLTLQSDGKILVVGSAEVEGPIISAVVILRFLEDGSLDPSFGDNGRVLDTIGSNAVGLSVQVQTDGKIVVGGYVLVSGSSSQRDFLLLRYHPNGGIDNSFGNNGVIITDMNNEAEDYAYKVLIDNDGRIILAGYSIKLGTSSNSSRDYAIARYLPDGTLDPGFGQGGKVINDFNGGTDAAYDLALQADGKILVAGGIRSTSGNADLVVVRYRENGAIDPLFGVGGVARAGIVGAKGLARGMGIDSKNRIIIGGWSARGIQTVSNFALARFYPNGQLDDTFGDDGNIITTFNQNNTTGSALVVQPDDKILLAGNIILDDNSLDIGVVRYLDQLPVGTLDLQPSLIESRIYPNPFQHMAVLEYELKQSEVLSIYLYDQAGKLVHTFVEQEARSSGQQKEKLYLPHTLTSGTYLITIKTAQIKTSMQVFIE